VHKSLVAAAALTLLPTLFGAPSHAAETSPGITDDTVTVGTIVPLSGPLAPLSIFGRQIAAYLQYVSDQGGVKMGDGKTRKIIVKVLDDGGQASRTVAAARELVEQDKVFAVIGVFGTNQNLSIVDYMNAKKEPHIFLMSAATNWGADPQKYPWTIGFPPVPGTQTAVFADYLKRTKPDAKVAIFAGNDDYGKAAVAGLKKAIAGSGITIVAEESFELSDPSVDSQIVRLAASNADVLFDFAIGRAALQSLQKANEIGWAPLRYVETTAASSGMIGKLPPQAADGLVSTIYLKDPNSPEFKDDPAMKRYQDAMAKYYGSGFDPTAQPTGAADAEAFVKALEAMKAPTQAALIEAARAMNGVDDPFFLDGIQINTAATHGFPINQMQIIVNKGGRFERVGSIVTGDPM
jgi:branched-chain amino acid transport system substrate-binding protein